MLDALLFPVASLVGAVLLAGALAPEGASGVWMRGAATAWCAIVMTLVCVWWGAS